MLMRRFVIGIATLPLMLVVGLLASRQTDKDSWSVKIAACTVRPSPTLKYVLDGIDRSKDMTPAVMPCNEMRTLNNIPEDALLVTTGRSAGHAVICATDTTDVPCRHRLAVVDDRRDSTQALKDALNYTEPSVGPLTETLERLFIKPSRFIKKKK